MQVDRMALLIINYVFIRLPVFMVQALLALPSAAEVQNGGKAADAL